MHRRKLSDPGLRSLRIPHLTDFPPYANVNTSPLAMAEQQTKTPGAAGIPLSTEATMVSSILEKGLEQALGDPGCMAPLAAALLQPLVKLLLEPLSRALAEALKDSLIQKVTDSLEFDLQKKITELTERVVELERLNQEYADDAELQEQYSRRNCLVVFGVPESEGENTDDIITDICTDILGVPVSNTDLDRTHRLGQKPTRNTRADDPKSKTRGIIVKFTSYQTRAKVYSNKKNLKGKRLFISESLTSSRLNLYTKLYKDHANDVIATWTQDGRIYVIPKEGDRVMINKLSDIDKVKLPFTLKKD